MAEAVKTKSRTAGGMIWSILSIVLCVASAIAYYVLSTDGENSPSVVYVYTIAAAVLQLVVVFVNRTDKGAAAYNCSSILAPCLVTLGLEQLLVGRIQWLGGVAAHNANFAPIGASFYVTIVLYVLAIVTSIVAAFLAQKKE